MSKHKIEEIIKKVAQSNGVREEEVRREIESALIWSSLSKKSKAAAEEAIAQLAKLTREKMK